MPTKPAVGDEVTRRGTPDGYGASLGEEVGGLTRVVSWMPEQALRRRHYDDRLQEPGAQT